MNVIENAWSTLKAKISGTKPFPKNENQLKKALRKFWHEEQKNGNHEKLVRSFERRIEALKKKNF